MTDQLRNPSSSSSSAPTLSRVSTADCAAGCGFFGSPQTDNYCSKCYKEKKALQLTSSSSSNDTISSNDVSTPALEPAAAVSTPSAIVEQQQSIVEPSPVTLEPLVKPSSDVIPTSIVSQAPQIVESSSTSTPSKKLKNRCQFCSKKVGLTFFACKCDDSAMFCSSHRYPHSHSCSFDHQQQQKAKLALNNPLVAHDKLERI